MRQVGQLPRIYIEIEIHENPLSVSPIIPCGRTTRRDEANGRFLQNDERYLKSPYFLVAY